MKKMIDRVLSLFLSVCLVGTFICGNIMGAVLAAGEAAEKGTHVIITHWHADGTVIDDDMGDLTKDGENVKNVSVFPFEGEKVAGYSISVGDDAFENKNNSGYDVYYRDNIHLAKMNVFYQKVADYDGKVDTSFLPEKDVIGTGESRQYNSSEGLHTNKDVTASGKSGREFDITLQSWYNEGQVADVGLILDASGSMAFTADTPSLINKSDFDDEEVSKFDNLTYIPPNILDKILDPKKTDNSRLGFGGYSYFVFDGKKATAEFVPLGYWDGDTITISDDETGAKHDTAVNGPDGDTMGYLLDSDLADLKGWFYVNSGSDYAETERFKGSKQYIGVEDGVLIQNYILPEGEMGDSDIGGPFVSPANSGVENLNTDLITSSNDSTYIYSDNADLQTKTPENKKVAYSWTEYSLKFTGTSAQAKSDNIDLPGAKALSVKDGYTRSEKNQDYKDTETDPQKTKGHSPVIFYFDNAGYLRCFFCNGYNNSNRKYGQCSYVFKKDDNQRIKTETLQAGLGRFVTALNEKSPQSKVSAVRFSLSKNKIANMDDKATEEVVKPAYDPERGKFILQDWTNDYTDMLNIISRSKGRSSDSYFSYEDNSEKDKVLNSYNYGLTGNTSTDVGLDIMNSILIPKISEELSDKSKNLIIFTDGKDTLVKENEWGYEELVEHDAYETAKKLKSEGWTIYCVVVPNGEITEDSWALRFIESLSGTAETDEITQQEETTDPTEPTTEAPSESTTESATTTATSDTGSGSETTTTTTETPLPQDVTGTGTDVENKWNNRFAAVNDKYCFLTKDSGDLDKTEALVQTFTDEVLSSIVGDLEGYTVQDYIDPRFDIVDGDKVIKLGDGGTITVVDSEGQTSPGVPYELSDGAVLNYDSGKQMYFVSWKNQSIPGNAVDVDKVNVWEKHLKLRAKDDFIGGNAVLTNGNDEMENYVFHPGDVDASSGTDDMASKNQQAGSSDLYPSKGFPRTVANVKPLQPKLDGLEQVIYKGESIVPEKRAADLLEAVKTVKITKDETEVEKEEELTENPYLDFIKEYAGQNYTQYSSIDEKLEALAADVIKSGEKGLTLDGYTYSDAGSESHKTDPLGSVTLRFTGFDGIDNPADELTLEDKKKEFGLEIEFTPMATSQSAQDAPAGTEVIAAEPEAAKDRVTANGSLVEDKNYKWDPTEKPAGNDFETVTVGGNDTTYTVSGEIAFAVRLDEQDIQALQDSGFDERLTYTVDLKKDDKSIDKPVTVFISSDNLKPGLHYAQNVENLEFGDYTFENVSGDTDEIKFSEIKLSGDEQEYKNIRWNAYPVSDGDVKIDPPDAEADRYIALQDGENNAFKLGTVKNDSSPAQVAAAEDTSGSGEALIQDDESYLNDRLGFAYVDVEIVTTTTTTTTTSTTTTTTTVATSLSDTESTEKPSEESTTETTTTTEEPVKPPVSESTTTAATATTQTKPATSATTAKATTHTDPASATTTTQKVTTHTDPATATTTTQKVTTHTDPAITTTTTQKVTTHTDPASATTTTQKVTTHTDPAAATTTTQNVTTHTDPASATTTTQNVTTHTDPEATTTTTQNVTTHTDPQNTTTAPGETGVSPGTGDTTTSAPTTDGGFAVTGSTTTTAGNDTQSPPATTPTTPAEPSSPSDTTTPSAGGTSTTPAGTGTSTLTTTTTTTTTGSGGNSGTHSPHTGDTKRAPFAMLATFAAIAIIARKTKKRDE